MAFTEEKDQTLVGTSSPAESTYVEQHAEEDDNIDASVPIKYRGTAADKRDMKVIGKTQVLRVRICKTPAIMASNMDDSETSNLSPCLVLPRLSWPAGRYYFRKRIGFCTWFPHVC